jgi:hypothetical protein
MPLKEKKNLKLESRASYLFTIAFLLLLLSQLGENLVFDYIYIYKEYMHL